jgi:hypothetical protein
MVESKLMLIQPFSSPKVAIHRNHYRERATPVLYRAAKEKNESKME